MMPIAQPRPSRNQPATIFIPGGYTPASAAPVATRRAMPTVGFEALATPTVASAAATADTWTSRRADQRSLRVRTAETSAPRTKPSCTEIVSQAVPVGVSCHTRESVGATADALNHGAIAKSSAMASTASTRRALTDRWDDRGTPRVIRTSRPGVPPAL